VVKAKTVTEKLDTASRRVGPLTIFGISDFWRVPTILPKRLLDLRTPLVDYTGVRPGNWVCLGGTARNCILVSRCDAGEAMAVEECAGDGLGGTPETSDSLESDVPLQEADDSDGVDAAVAGDDKASPTDESDHAGESGAEAQDETGPVELWRFELRDLSGRHCADVHMVRRNRALSQAIEAAQCGAGLWVYGLVSLENGRLTIKEAEPILEADLGEIHAFYPSKSRRELMKVVKRKGKSKTSARGRWVIRKMSSNTVGVLVRDKNRFAIARCAAVLRDRLQLRSASDEWQLMQTAGSPAPTLEATFKLAHSPGDVAAGLSAARALQRLVAVEMLQHIAREREARGEKRIRIPADAHAFRGAVEAIRRNGGIEMSSEQRIASAEILTDLAGPFRTHRLLSGDVGTGKTVVFAVVACCVHEAGGLAVILEPRSQLAEQVHANLQRFFPDVPMQLITGSSKDTRTIERGIVVGTTGIWSRLAATGCAPALIIADEQQKFGVSQRAPWEHSDASIVEATATAIPRTQALIEYGGMEVSMLRQCHVKREIVTRLVIGGSELEEIYGAVADRVLKEGKNAILVFPNIDFAGDDTAEEDQDAPPKALVEAVETWEAVFPDAVGVIHGRMDEAARSLALSRFEGGQYKVLIGTSLLEVGLDLRQADMMVIHHPERLGVSAVHQLRGRLARKGGHGWCYLACSPNVNEGQLALLKTLEVETDGFKLAVADMERRGFGDLRRHARQQSGEYQGFLVDRPPTAADLEWANEHCARWLQRDAGTSNLLDDEVTLVNSLVAATRGPPAVRRRKASSMAAVPAAQDSVQIVLFGSA
jgi:ATP-dependent DNA helicase RecG